MKNIFLAHPNLRGTVDQSAVALLMTVLWLPTIASAWAQTAPPGTAAAQPTPVTELKTIPPRMADSGSPCPDRPAAGLSKAEDILITLDPDTLWRPRGGEVHFRLNKPGSTIGIRTVQVCMGWSRPSTSDSQQHAVVHDLVPAPIVRPIDNEGVGTFYGAVVPNLTAVPIPWLNWRRRPDVDMTAMDTVPVADMVVVVTLADGKTAEILLPVGVTSALYAAAVVGICLVGFLLVAWLISAGSPSFALRLVSSSDGYASLSQFQILLWTVTIGASAVYVMVLSGNLINLTDGTLILLGIASAAALAARFQSKRGSPQIAPAVVDRTPRWSDLVIVGGAVDLTRVQMLVFTLITAAFVSLRVVSGYIIPDIPTNFLLLMGLSNGVYITGRQVPNQEDGPIKAATN